MELDTNVNPNNPEAGDGGPEQTPEKTYTQAEMDKAIGERLARENVFDNREIVELLKEFGYEGTPAEIKAVLKIQAKEAKEQRELADKQKELEDLQEQADQNGTSPELLAEIRGLKAEVKELKQEKADQKAEAERLTAAQSRIDKEIKEFMEKYPDIDHEKLSSNEKFNRFFKRSSKDLTLTEIYEDYIDLIGDAEKAAIAKVNSNKARSTSSGKGKGELDGGTYGLTDRQQALAKENGISYKVYAERLAMIKE